MRIVVFGSGRRVGAWVGENVIDLNKADAVLPSDLRAFIDGGNREPIMVYPAWWLLNTQDRAVHPCGDGSDSESDTRRIVASEGTLAVRETGIKCPTPSGLVFTGTYEVDGLSSTGVFAGARGSGDVTVDVATHTSTLSGRLKLAASDD